MLLLQIRLLLHLGIFLLRVAVKTQETALLVLTTFLLALLASWQFLANKTGATHFEFVDKQAEKQVLRDKLYQELRKQSSHRDLLYNLSILETDAEKSQLLLEKARLQDPNNALFR